jgi:predicted dehydrogenase
LIRVGIIGTGWVAADRHFPSFRADPRARVTAVFDRDPSRAAAFARPRKIPSHFDDVDRFLGSGIDAVAICTPPQAHARAIEAALAAGKHVLVEKPMTLDHSEGMRLAGLARDRRLLLCPAHNFLFARSTARVESWFRDGSAGTVRFAMGLQSSSWRRRLPNWFGELPGGLFFDESPHLLYLMRRFLGELEVRDAWRTVFDGDSPAAGRKTGRGVGAAAEGERIEARLRGERGEGYLSMWFGAPLSEWALVVACTKAVIAIDLFRDIAIRLPAESSHGRTDVVGTVARATYQMWSGIAATGVRVLGGDQYFGHDRLIRHFIDALEGGPPPTTGEDGARVVGLIDRIWRTASERG